MTFEVCFIRPHLSITELNDYSFEDLTILTGVNGSGKTHFLDAIRSGALKITGVAVEDIVGFTYEDFKIDTEKAYAAHDIRGEKARAWTGIEAIQNQVRGPEATLPDDLKSLTWTDRGPPLWDYETPSLNSYRQSIEFAFKQNHNLRGQAWAPNLLSFVKALPCPIGRIKDKDFIDRYETYVFKKDFLPQALGSVIWDYYLKWSQNDYNRIKYNEGFSSYRFLDTAEFQNLHGPKPWDAINSILEKFGCLDYKIKSPEGADLFGSYQTELTHVTKENLVISFDSLSSGERILMALMLSVFRYSLDRGFPKVLLLDELDATLHPSMMQNMLQVIEEIFVGRGSKVILVTHSPSTVAFAEERSLRVMKKTGPDRIICCSKRDALSILTDGIATIDEGTIIFRESEKHGLMIISEGKNYCFIERALSIAGLNKVKVLRGIEAISGKDQLKTLFDFMSTVPHSNKVVFVWDCDYTKILADQNNTFFFKFVRNERNQLAKTGIENLFPEDIFEGFIKRTILSDNTEIRQFESGRKRDFENFVIDRNVEEDFANFEPLISYIRSLM